MKKISVFLAISLVLLISTAALAADDAANEKAVEHYNNGEYQKAVDMLKEYVDRMPDPEAYYLIGYSLYKLGRHDEANKYFEYAFFIDPLYSPTPALIAKGKWPPEKIGAGSGMETEPAPQPPAPAPAPAPEAPAPPTPAEAPVAIAPAPAPEAPASPTPAEAPVAIAPAPEAPVAVEPAPEAPSPPPVSPRPPVSVKPMEPPFGLGIEKFTYPESPLFGLVIIVLSIGLYFYYSLCLFLIAKNTGVRPAWTAWVPIIQIWTFVSSAGKPGWWILLLLVPVINLFATVYLWMLITGRLGKNMYLGLLVLVPVINIFYPAFLAFSRSRVKASSTSAFASKETDDFDTGMPKPPDIDMEDFGFDDEPTSGEKHSEADMGRGVKPTAWPEPDEGAGPEPGTPEIEPTAWPELEGDGEEKEK